jgi:hypothetical protein
MKKILLFALILLTSGMVFAEQVIVKLDNGTTAGNMWRTGRDTYEESVN